jgi:1,4-alpha-glucan branching enzyme
MSETLPDRGCAKAPWRTIYFRLDAPDASQVSVVGDFNGWDPDRNPLTRNVNDVWEEQLPLPPGRYGYAFVVDGRRQPDPNCETRVETPEGEICQIEVSAPHADDATGEHPA